MDVTFKILFTIAFELLFVYNFVALITGMIRLRRSGAEIITEKMVWLQIYALLALSVIAQVGFFCTLTGPNYYILAMVSAFAALYPNVMASESIFACKGKQLWFGFKSYRKGTVQAGISQRRRRNLNVLMTITSPREKQFVLKTTPELWQKIEPLL